jgi:hypothetical protein
LGSRSIPPPLLRGCVGHQHHGRALTPRYANSRSPLLRWAQPAARCLRRSAGSASRPGAAIGRPAARYSRRGERPSGLMGYTGSWALPCSGSVQHGPRSIRAEHGLTLRHSGPTRTGTKVHRACIVPGQIGLGPSGPFGHL